MLNNILFTLRGETSQFKFGFKVRPDDTFIVSYPKSGNTWIRFILANLLQPDEIINFRNIDGIVPDVHKSINHLKDITSPRIMKIHKHDFDYFQKTIYIVRDGRDTLVSYYHYNMDLNIFHGTFSQFLRSSLPTRFGTWSEHVHTAMKFNYEHPERMLYLRYEDMLIDLPSNIAKIASFCGITVNSGLIERVTKACTFDSLKKNEQTYGSEILNKDIQFFRKGTSRQWQDYFTPEDMDLFLESSRGMLLANNYQI